MSTTAERLNQAVKQLAPTQEERAKALKMTARALRRWSRGDIPQIIETLEQRGIITIADLIDATTQPSDAVG